MIDFAKHNKGLRLCAALFHDISIFETDSFQDIYTSVDIYPEYNDHIYILYKLPFYDPIILNKLKGHKTFLEARSIVINNQAYVLYSFSIPKEKQEYYSAIKQIGSLGVNQLDMLNVFVTWKKYLTDKFYECYYVKSVKSVLKCEKTKGA